MLVAVKEGDAADARDADDARVLVAVKEGGPSADSRVLVAVKEEGGALS